MNRLDFKNIPIISIIIPVYNAEKYLRRCIESILTQSLTDFELILINDGSIDKSAEICDEYAKKDNRIIVVHRCNGGASAARNDGLRIAKGKYIGFVDADDYIDKDMYMLMLSATESENADIVVSDYFSIDKFDNIEPRQAVSFLNNDCLLSHETITPYILLKITECIWNCLYRSEIIQKNKIFFDTNLKVNEDWIFNIYAFGAADRVKYIKKSLYYYAYNSSSLVHTYKPDALDISNKTVVATNKSIDLMWGGRQDFKNAFLVRYLVNVITVVESIRDKKSAMPFIKRYKNVRNLLFDIKTLKSVEIINNNPLLKNEFEQFTFWCIKQKKVFILSLRKNKLYHNIRRIIVKIYYKRIKR